jgi:uncharacterized membrane protein YfcA
LFTATENFKLDDCINFTYTPDLMKAFKIVILVLVIVTVVGELLSAFGEIGVQILSAIIPAVLVILAISLFRRRRARNRNNNR